MGDITLWDTLGDFPRDARGESKSGAKQSCEGQIERDFLIFYILSSLGLASEVRDE